MQGLTWSVARDDKNAEDGHTVRQLQKFDLTPFRKPSRDAFCHVVVADPLLRLKVSAGAAAQRLRALQVCAFNQAGREVRRDQLDGFAGLDDKESTHEHLGRLR